jgi:hypothetical protein
VEFGQDIVQIEIVFVHSKSFTLRKNKKSLRASPFGGNRRSCPLASIPVILPYSPQAVNCCLILAESCQPAVGMV